MSLDYVLAAVWGGISLLGLVVATKTGSWSVFWWQCIVPAFVAGLFIELGYIKGGFHE